MSRFAQTTEDDLRDLLENKDSKETKKVLRMAKKILEDYLCSKGENVAVILSGEDKPSLCQTLRKFYAEIRQVNTLFHSLIHCSSQQFS